MGTLALFSRCSFGLRHYNLGNSGDKSSGDGMALALDIRSEFAASSTIPILLDTCWRRSPRMGKANAAAAQTSRQHGWKARNRNLGDLYAESGQTLQGSFSAVSKPNFASKYSLELGSI